MAVVHEKQTGSTATGTLAISAATAGNELVAFYSQKGVGTPTVADSIGSSGWTVETTHAVYSASANSVWVARKTAVGGETSITFTAAGESPVAEGISYFELSGTYTVEKLLHTDNISSKTTPSPSITTTNANEVILAAMGSVAATGAISAWTGSPSMTNVETASTRCMGGWAIPGSTVSATTVTANWETSKVNGLLLIALTPVEVAAAKSVTVI